MERLTVKIMNTAIKKLAEYEDFEEIFRSKMTDATCDFLKDKEEFAKWLDRNKWIAKKCDEYAMAEEQGKLLKLPCAVGDTVWDNDFGRLCNYEVTGFSFGNLNDWCVEEEMVLDQVLVHYTNSMGSITGSFAVSEIGKTVFLTQKEAEAALKEMSE